MSSEKRKPRRPTDARRRDGKKSRIKAQTAGGGKTGPRNRKAADPEGISTLGKWVMAGAAVLALLLLVGVGFLIRHLINKSAYEDAVANERWNEVLEYDPNHGKALAILAKTKLEEIPPNVSAAFEYIDRIPSDEPDTDSYVSPRGLKKPLIQTVRANAHAHRAAAAADKNPDEAIEDYNKALANKADMSLLTPVRGKLVSVLLGRALSLSDEGEDKAAVEQLQEAYTLDQTGPSTAIKFENKPSGQIPLRLGFLEFASKLDAYFNAPDVAGLNGFCEDIEKFFIAAAGVDRSLFGTGRFNAGGGGYGRNGATGSFIENAEKWEARKEQFAARMHDMSAGFSESDVDASMKVWKLAERISPDSTPVSLKVRFKEILVRNAHDAVASDRSNAGTQFALLSEFDQSEGDEEYRKVVRLMQSPDELNSLLVDISRGTGWPKRAKSSATELVGKFRQNADAPPLIQVIHDSKGIIGGALPRYLFGRTAALVWQPNPDNDKGSERLLNFLQGEPNESGLIYRVPAKMLDGLRGWLVPESDSSATTWLNNCQRLYVVGRIAPGPDSFRLQDTTSQPVERADADAHSWPKPHKGTFFVDRIIATVSPSHSRNGDNKGHALTGQLFTADGQYDLLIHDVLLGNSVAKLGHPALPILAGISDEIHLEYVVGQSLSTMARASLWRSRLGKATKRVWPDPYLQRLATADVTVLQTESRKAADVISALFESGGVIGKDYGGQKLTSEQKGNLHKGKTLLSAVRAISDGSDSWLADLNEYKDAFAALAGKLEENAVAKSLAQQWVGVTTPSNFAIVSLEDVIPLANKLVTEQKEELEAARNAADASPDNNPAGQPAELRYWPDQTVQDMTSGSPAPSQLYATVLNDTVSAMFEEEDREKKQKEEAEAHAKASAQTRASWKIDKSKPFIYVIVRPGTMAARDWNRVVVTVQNGTKSSISVVTQVDSNIMGNLFVDALTLNIPPNESKQSNSSWQMKEVLMPVWENRSYTLSCDVTGAPKGVQLFYAVPDQDFGHYRAKRSGSKVMPISELRSQFGR